MKGKKRNTKNEEFLIDKEIDKQEFKRQVNPLKIKMFTELCNKLHRHTFLHQYHIIGSLMKDLEENIDPRTGDIDGDYMTDLYDILGRIDTGCQDKSFFGMWIRDQLEIIFEL